MVTITENAGLLLAQMRPKAPLPSTLRMTMDAGDFVIGSSEPAPDDEILFSTGDPVLRLSSEAAKALSGFTVATEDTPSGPVLTILPVDEVSPPN